MTLTSATTFEPAPFNLTDFNDDDGIIPHGTIAKVMMMIKAGKHYDEQLGLADGFATYNKQKGSIYLNCKFIVLEGEYVDKEIWSLIGIYSPKGEKWGKLGRLFIRDILNSARGVSSKDKSEHAQNARRISGFAELQGIEFVALIEAEKDDQGKDRNIIRKAITCDHHDYARLMGQSNQEQSNISSWNE